MVYAQFFLALPLASAVILDKRDPAQYAGAPPGAPQGGPPGAGGPPPHVVVVQETAVETAVATTVVTVTVPAGGPSAHANNWGGEGNPWQYNGAAPWEGNQGPPNNDPYGFYNHAGYHHSHKAPPAPPATTQPPPAPKPAQPAPKPVQLAPKPVQPAPKPAPAPSSGGGGGCPVDLSGAHLSGGVNGHPDRSMIDSINEMRRMYNPNAACLDWSDSLSEASTQCANIRSESALRANSGVVSDPGYSEGGGDSIPLAKTNFENSMYLMLCQSPDDAQLQGKCPFKTGEVGCTDGTDVANPACTGHHDMIVDKENSNRFMGAACNAQNKWMSASFSKTRNIFD